MNGLKKALEQLGFNTAESQGQVLELLYRAGCFSSAQLNKDLKASHFTRAEITALIEQIKDAQPDNFERFVGKFWPTFSTDKTNDNTQLVKIFAWLNLIMHRILPGTKPNPADHAWLSTNRERIQHLANGIAEVEYADQKSKLLQQYKQFHAIVVMGGNYPELIASSHCLKTMINPPLATSVFYLPFNRAASYETDGEAAVRSTLVTRGQEIKNEEQLVAKIKKKIQKYLANLKNIYPQANESDSTPSAPILELPEISIQVLPSDKCNSAAAAIYAFDRSQAELITPHKKLLFISNKKDLTELTSVIKAVLGTAKQEDVAIIAAFSDKLDVLQALRDRIAAHFTALENELYPQSHRTSVLGTVGKIGLFGATVAAIGAAGYAAVTHKEKWLEWLPKRHR